MKKILALLAAALLNAGTHAEELNVTFGASSDLAAKYGEHDLTGNAKQNADIAAPHISIGGLDLDGLGANDDKIEVKFAVTATGGNVARLAQGSPSHRTKPENKTSSARIVTMNNPHQVTTLEYHRSPRPAKIFILRQLKVS